MIYVTGIKPTGQMHLGNYISIITPLKKYIQDNNQVYLFIADAHALTTLPEKQKLYSDSFELIKTLMTFFYDDILTNKLILYRQSAIPETFELAYLISQFCSVGLLNRSHAYKSAVEKNIEHNYPPDHKINSFLKIYPILMAADILQFDANIVPVGQDQLQHIEIAQEIARIANNFFKKELLVVPKAFIQTETVLPGIDGRKMSKSYNNTIKIFEDDKKLKKLIFSIATNSKNIGEPKYEGESHVTTIYKELSTKYEYSILLDKMKEGIGWGEVKQILLDKIYEIRNNPIYMYNTLTDSQVISTLGIMEKKIKEIIANKVSNIKTALGLMNDE